MMFETILNFLQAAGVHGICIRFYTAGADGVGIQFVKDCDKYLICRDYVMSDYKKRDITILAAEVDKVCNEFMQAIETAETLYSSNAGEGVDDV